MKKIKVGILFGGRSAEHEVSVQSAKNVINAVDRNKYQVELIYLDKKGIWYLVNEKDLPIDDIDLEMEGLYKFGHEISIIPGKLSGQFYNLSLNKEIKQIDVIFPVLHGPYGEDGTVQGMLKLLNIPFVGAGVLGSAVGMDKDFMKRLLRDANINIARFSVYHKYEREIIEFDNVINQLNLPLFIKPANLGSSVGITKVTNEKEFYAGIDIAFQYDKKIIIEEEIKGREIECSVLGNNKPVVSLPGEIISNDEFYSYQAKYIDKNGAQLEIPAKLTDNLIKQIQDISLKSYKVLNCEGMARVDMFLTDKDKLVVNEINTIPGFTRISMYPKLWEVSGIPYSKLIDKLIMLAIDRYEEEHSIKKEMDFN